MFSLHKTLTVCAVVALSILLVNCGKTSPAPMDDRSFKPAQRTVYVAGSGDTLYSIAFLSGLDYRELAAWNGIAEPYTIRRGQKIALKEPESNGQFESPTTITRPLDTQVAIPQPQAESPAIVQAPSTSKNKVVIFNNTWKWPVSASQIVNYKASGQNNGLDITSKDGAAVIASAAGKVVYAGNGLKGYGNLVIIKHSDTYLSAYAHNRSLSVGEGDNISQGQQIAELGETNNSLARLHFEIRKNGTPVNPLGLLPKKTG